MEDTEAEGFLRALVNHWKNLPVRPGEIMVPGYRRERVMCSGMVRERAAVDIPAQNNVGVQELEYTEHWVLAGRPTQLDS